MCGIIGQFAFGELNEEKERIRQESMIFLGSELLQLTQERGADATGVALMFQDGNYIGLKMGIPAIEFIARFGKNEKEYGGIIKVWRKTQQPAKVFLGHCRKTTRGSSLDNNNNHPIRIGDVIGIHNGTVENDDKIFKHLECKRDGTVDSEAIFRLIHHYSKNGTEPITAPMLKEVVQRLDGTFAVLTMSGNNPYQVSAFRNGKPIDMALIKPLHLVVCSSEKKFIETAIFRYNKFINLYISGHTFPTISKGDVEYKIMPDDSAVIFDLRTDITPKTEIMSLYDWESMPRLIKNGYSKTYTNVGNYNRSNFTGANSANTKTDSNPPALPNPPTKETTVTTPTENVTSSKVAGKVWSKKMRKYICTISPDSIEKGRIAGNVEVDVDGNKIEQLSRDGGANSKFELVESKDADTGILAEKVEIKELPAPKIVEPQKKTERLEVELINPDDTSTTVEVDVTVDTQAVEGAEEVAKAAASFKAVSEVLDALEIHDEETLKSIPLTALANRMKRVFLRAGYLKGFCAAKRADTADEKTSVAEEHIRHLKNFVFIFDSILQRSGVGCRQAAVERAVIEAFENGKKIPSNVFNKIFSAGDERKSEVLRIIKATIAEKANR